MSASDRSPNSPPDAPAADTLAPGALPPDASPAAIAEAGRHARDRGDPASANPHAAGSAAHAVWARAFASPDREAAAATPEA
ncbi:hypothetical protein [Methylobacterium sp. A54F]